MDIISEIKEKRNQLLTTEQKCKIIDFVKYALVKGYSVVIYGAPHFGEWAITENRCEVPYRLHPAVEDMLKSMGFRCTRYYNKGGVEQGLEVRI